MKKHTILGRILTMILMSTLLFSCKKEGTDEEPTADNVISAAREQGDLDLFVEAVQKSGLSQTLTQGTYTIFAPTDLMFQAFLNDLGLDHIDDLINNQGQEKTRQLLMYHILEGTEVRADEFENAYVSTAATNASGHSLSLYTSRLDTIVALNKNTATIVKSNIDGGNGIIHKVNGVLSLPTVTGLLDANPEYNTLISAMRQAQGDLTIDFRNEENMNVTFFAPSVEAFLSLYSDESSFNDFNGFVQHYGAAGIKDLLLFHALSTGMRAEELTTGNYATLLTGTEMIVNKDNEGTIALTDPNGDTAVVIAGNITAVNGTIHKINYVLTPQD